MATKKEDDRKKVMKILNANKKKSFVDRILNQKNYPVLDMGDGNVATHLMAWSEVDGKYRVYPTVLWNGKALTEYDPEKAFDFTTRTNNYIDFDTKKEADWFSKNYKVIWDK